MAMINGIDVYTLDEVLELVDVRDIERWLIDHRVPHYRVVTTPDDGGTAKVLHYRTPKSFPPDHLAVSVTADVMTRRNYYPTSVIDSARSTF